jgi:hypothetical protein
MIQVWQIIAIAIVIAIAVVAGLWLYDRSRTRRLRQRFGSEYERLVSEFGDSRQAEAELARSEAKVRKLKVRPLNTSERAMFLAEWRRCQARFVDDPAGALNDAERVLTEIMRTCGFAVDNPYDRLTDISAAYPGDAPAYREANDILIRNRVNGASIAELRTAFLDFRELFYDILERPGDEAKRAA